MKETVTYIIKRKDNDLYVTNTPSHNFRQSNTQLNSEMQKNLME